MFDPTKLTYKSQETISHAAQLAIKHNHPALEPVHLLFSLLTIDGPAREVVSGSSENLTQLLSQLQSKLNDLPQVETTQEPKMTAQLVKIFQKAADISHKHHEDYVSQDSLLLALLDQNKSLQELLSDQGISYQKLNEEVSKMRQGQKSNSPTSDTSFNVIEKYTINLTDQAKLGKLDPVIGRDSEIRRLMQVLSRRTKNNPVLIGDPGVGKTAIVEDLAQRINAGDVPESLQNKQLVVLDIASVLAGAKFRGEFEERLKSILNQLTKNSDKFIVFIDELHTIVGAGAAQGSVDASNMLKPGLARGELHLIGATTISEYRQHIEKDSALERRFQPIMVTEPSVEDTIAILRGLKEKYEVHHGLGINDDAVVAAVNLSNRYITDRFLPDKAIDLLDEAASSIKIQSQSKPETLDLLTRKITQLEIEQKALSKENSADAKTKNSALKKDLSNLKEQAKTLNSRWAKQKQQLETISKIREEIDSLKVKLEEAERQIELDEAAKIKYGQLPEKTKLLKQLESDWSQIPSSEKLIKDDVSKQDIATVVARWTGIPVDKVDSSDTHKLAGLEDQLHQRVIGQKDAVKAVSAAIRRSRVGLSQEGKPIAVFLFLGPTGVGKTETAKALAQVMFDNQKSLVRLDMSEYKERHTVSRLIGSPPGYIGHEQGGQLTEAVRRRPYSLILLDEIEKAHDDVYTLFLQIFDDGRLTDGKGRTVDFKNTIIIMTSNLGSDIIGQPEQDQEAVQSKVWDLIKTKFPPEFINRIDQIILYESLTQKDMVKVVDLELEKVQQRLKAKDISLKVTGKAKSLLAKKGYDPLYGARPLKRLIQTEILDEIATLITNSASGKLSAINVDALASKFKFSHT